MIYQHDTGTKIEFLVDEASFITEAKIIVKKPDNEVIEWVAQIDDKSIFYITNSNDLDLAGLYHLQPLITMNKDNQIWRGRGNIVKMEVLEGL